MSEDVLNLITEISAVVERFSPHEHDGSPTRRNLSRSRDALRIMVAEPQHQRRSTHVHCPWQDEPDGCGVGMPHKCRPQVLQGQGRDAVRGELVVSWFVGSLVG